MSTHKHTRQATQNYYIFETRIKENSLKKERWKAKDKIQYKKYTHRNWNPSGSKYTPSTPQRKLVCLVCLLFECALSYYYIFLFRMWYLYVGKLTRWAPIAACAVAKATIFELKFVVVLDFMWFTVCFFFFFFLEMLIASNRVYILCRPQRAHRTSSLRPIQTKTGTHTFIHSLWFLPHGNLCSAHTAVLNRSVLSV